MAEFCADLRSRQVLAVELLRFVNGGIPPRIALAAPQPALSKCGVCGVCPAPSLAPTKGAWGRGARPRRHRFRHAEI